MIEAKQIEIPAEMEQDRKRPTYRQHWASYTKAQENEREHFDRLLHDLCSGIKPPVQRRGRPRMPLGDVIFALVTQAYVNRSGRRTVSEVRSAAASGLVDQSMSSKTISKYLNKPELGDLLRRLVRESASPLACVETRFAVDATGMSTCAHVRWFDEKHGRTRTKKKFVKLHACVGTHTGVFSDVLVTDSKGEGTGDVNNLPSLVQGTAENLVAQRNEILARCVAYNIAILVRSMFDLGLPIEFDGSADRGGHHVH